MQWGKRSFFLLLNGIAMLLVLLYVLFWLMGSSTTGQVLRPLDYTLMVVEYKVENKAYTQSFMRSGIPLAQRAVKLRYQKWNPSLARLQSFMGIAAEPLAWWFVFFLASAMLLLTNNTVFSKGTRFRLQKRFPWLQMDEFFPAPGAATQSDDYRPKKAQLPDGWRFSKEENT